MENNPRKSKAFIITFILILLVLVAGYLLFRNRDSLFGTKGESSLSKIFSPLLGTSKNKNVTVIEEPAPTTPNETNTSIITDVNGNKLVLAQAGENIQKGDVLYIAGFNESKQPIVMKAIANDPKKSLVFGVAAEDIKMGSLGNILIEGILIDIDTDRKETTNWAVNNPLYLSDKIYGGMTKNPPVSPSFVIPVGSVLKVHEINGSIRIGNITGNENINGDQITNWKKFNSKFLYDSMKDIQDYWDSIFDDYPYSDEYDDDNDFPFTPIQKPSGSSSSSSGNNNNDGTNDDGSDDDGDEGDDTDDNSKNICLNIEQNPLTFTPEEKARLAILLRKFYLISSTLKTDEDITTIYNEIDQQKNFIAQIEGLTAQCYFQIPDSKLIANNWKRHGNPWYTKTSGGTFPYTNENTGYLDKSLIQSSIGPGCRAVSGYYYGTLEKSTKIGPMSFTKGSSCDVFNNFIGDNSCNYGDVSLKIRSGALPYEEPLEAGCKWKDGVDFESTERILNIW